MDNSGGKIVDTEFVAAAAELEAVETVERASVASFAFEVAILFAALAL